MIVSPRLEEGPLKLYRNQVWVPLHAVIKAKILVLHDSVEVEVASSSVMMPVRRGAPADVEPPAGEENCQFRLGELLLSAPSFDACAEWMSGLKSYNKRVSEARKSVELNKNQVSKALSPAASRSSSGTVSSSSPAMSPSATMRSSAASSPGSDSQRRSRSFMSLRGSSRSDDNLKDSSPTGSPGGRKKIGGGSIQDLSKKASDLLFRRKERDARKAQRKATAAGGDDDDESSLWPEVGRVVMSPSKPEVAQEMHSVAMPEDDITAAEVHVEALEAFSGPNDENAADEELQEAEDLVAAMEKDMAVMRESELALEEAAALELELAKEADVVKKLAKEELARQRDATQEMVNKVKGERDVERKRALTLQQQLQKQVSDMRTKLKAAQEWESLCESLKAELATEQETSHNLREDLAKAEDSVAASTADAEHYANEEVVGLQASLEHARQEIAALRKESSDAGQQLAKVGNEKDQALLNLQLKNEAFDRQRSTMQLLMEEKVISRKTMSGLRAQLDEQLQDVFSETMRADDIETKLTQMGEDKERVEARAEAKENEVKSLSAVVEDQRERIEGLESRTDSDSVRLTQLKTELDATRELLRASTVELETMRSSMAETEAKTKLESERSTKELAEVKDSAARDIDKLKRSVEAVASGRGRLEQQAEMQGRLDAAEEELEEERSRLENQISMLQEENETLAESNEQLIAALEADGGDSDRLAELSSRLDLQDWEGRCKEIEAELTFKMVALESAASEKDSLIARVTTALKQLKADLSAAEDDGKDKSQRINVLEERLVSFKKEFELLKSVLATTKESNEAMQEEFAGKSATMTATITDLEAKLDEERTKVANLESELREAQQDQIDLGRTIADNEAEKEETGSELKSIRDRLNDAIQERWLMEEKLKKTEKEMELKEKIPGLGLSVAEIDAKERDLNRRIQDLEGQSKRAKLESQEMRLKLGDQIRNLQEDRAKTEEVMKKMAMQIVELEDDLAVAEEANLEYEQLLKLAISQQPPAD